METFYYLITGSSSSTSLSEESFTVLALVNDSFLNETCKWHANCDPFAINVREGHIGGCKKVSVAEDLEMLVLIIMTINHLCF